MSLYLGIDTSNYCTSAALYGNVLCSRRSLLAVKQGELGLRQSDAVFQHVKALPGLIEQLSEEIHGHALTAVGVSVRPRDADGSYMPCFLAGESLARGIAATHDIPLHRFSHQAGHMAAGAWSADRLDLLSSRCLVWHVSGGTTELLINNPIDKMPSLSRIGGTSDLNAGQLIDRIGVKLGLSFPAGAELEILLSNVVGANSVRPQNATVQKQKSTGMDFSLSGMQNKAEKLIAYGVPHPEIARWVMDSVAHSVINATVAAEEAYGKLPVLCVGGVFANKWLCEQMKTRFDAVTALPAYSGDNAMGIAVLAGGGR